LIIAIDGGVASGKSAVGRRVGERLGLPFIDSGLMYRAITRLVGERGIDPQDSSAVTQLADTTKVRIDGERVWADGAELTQAIYDTDYADALPVISATPGVRRALVEQQRHMAKEGVVMAGRDIGTVVFPHADHKFFLVASLDEKVRRLAAQYQRRG
jgi:cytidylate kinase